MASTDRNVRTKANGFSMIEIMITGAVLGVIALIVTPAINCHLQSGRVAGILEDMKHARGQVELFEMEQGRFPVDLQEAYGDKTPPHTVVYCIDPGDANAGHGNEECTFFDQGNPSGQNEHGGFPGLGYLLRTHEEIAPCKNIDFAFLSCCGQQPDIVGMDEDRDPPGHPGS